MTSLGIIYAAEVASKALQSGEPGPGSGNRWMSLLVYKFVSHFPFDTRTASYLEKALFIQSCRGHPTPDKSRSWSSRFLLWYSRRNKCKYR